MGEFSERLRAEREKNGCSVKEIARVVKVHKQTVYDWLSGRYVPRSEHVVAIASLFGTSADHMIHGTDDKAREEVLSRIRELSALLPTSQAKAVLHIVEEFYKKSTQNP